MIFYIPHILDLFDDCKNRVSIVSVVEQVEWNWRCCCLSIWFIVGSGIIKAISTKTLDHRYLNLNLNSIMEIQNHSKCFSFFLGLAPFVVVTVLFSWLWVSSSNFFIENPPSHIHFGVLLKLLQRRVKKPFKHLSWSFSWYS